MVKLEIELTEEQMEQVKTLEKNDISIGEAISILFEVKDLVLSSDDDIKEEISSIDTLKNKSLDVSKREKILQNDYGEINDESYDVVIQKIRHKVSWNKVI